MSEYQNDRIGKVIYVMGNGPSLNRIDVGKLHDRDTISFNRAYIAYEDWGFYPKFYMVVDRIVLENIKEKIKALMDTTPIERFFLPAWSADYFGPHPKVQYLHFKRKFPLDRWFWGNSFHRLSLIANVGATSIPVMRIMGYDTAIILGTDCNYQEQNIKKVEIEVNKKNAARKIVYKSSGDEDPNHFRPDYFGKGTEYSKPQQQNHYNGWKFIARNMKRKKMNIILCSPGSTLTDLFPSEDFSTVIQQFP